MNIGVICLRSCRGKKKDTDLKKSGMKGIQNLNDLRGTNAVALTTAKAAV